MKTKLLFLILATFFTVSITKAQYGAPCPDNRVILQGQISIPGPSYAAVYYRSAPVNSYYACPPQRVADYGYREDCREYRGDWREEAYRRYCHENCGYRMSREEFYRSRCGYRGFPEAAPEKVVMYRY